MSLFFCISVAKGVFNLLLLFFQTTHLLQFDKKVRACRTKHLYYFMPLWGPLSTFYEHEKDPDSRAEAPPGDILQKVVFLLRVFGVYKYQIAKSKKQLRLRART